MLDPINHYSLSNPATVYDEESLTVLELCARIAAKYNAYVSQVNTNETNIKDIQTFIRDTLPGDIDSAVVERLTEMLANGAFDDLINNNRASAKMFGAVGDGVADDTNALLAWYKFVSDNGLTGYLPVGTYLLNQTLIAKNTPNFTVIGESKTGTIIKIASDATSCFAIHDSGNGCSISNLTIDLNQTADATQGFGLYVKNSDNVSYEDIIIKNIGYGALMAFHDNAGSQIKNLYINRVEMYGIDGKNVDGVHPTGLLMASVYNAHVTNCYAEKINYYPYEFKNFSESCFFSNCTAKDCYQGFYLGGDAEYPEGRSHYCEDIVFDSCVAIDCFSPFVVGHCKRVAFNNCRSFCDNMSGYKVTGISARDCSEVSITGEYWFRYTGIDIRNAENVTVCAATYICAGETESRIPLTFVAPLTNVHVTITSTNNTRLQTYNLVPDGVYLNLMGCREVLRDPDAQSKIILLGGDTAEHYINSDYVVEAPTLRKAYYSHDTSTPYVTTKYGTRLNERIEIEYNYSEAKIKFRFIDSSGNLIGTNEIAPNTAG